LRSPSICSSASARVFLDFHLDLFNVTQQLLLGFGFDLIQLLFDDLLNFGMCFCSIVSPASAITVWVR